MLTTISIFKSSVSVQLQPKSVQRIQKADKKCIKTFPHYIPVASIYVLWISVSNDFFKRQNLVATIFNGYITRDFFPVCFGKPKHRYIQSRETVRFILPFIHCTQIGKLYDDCTWYFRSNDTNNYIVTILHMMTQLINIPVFQIGEGSIADSRSRIFDMLTTKPMDWFFINADVIWIRILQISCRLWDGKMSFKLETHFNGEFDFPLKIISLGSLSCIWV